MALTSPPSGFGRPLWHAAEHLNRTHGYGLTAVDFNLFGPDLTADDPSSVTLRIFGPTSTVGVWQIEAAYFSVTAAGGITPGANGVIVNLQLVDSASTGVAGTGVSSVVTGFGAPTIYEIPVSTQQVATPLPTFTSPLVATTSLNLRFDSTGVATDFSAIQFFGTVYLRHAPPPR